MKRLRHFCFRFDNTLMRCKNISSSNVAASQSSWLNTPLYRHTRNRIRRRYSDAGADTGGRGFDTTKNYHTTHQNNIVHRVRFPGHTSTYKYEMRGVWKSRRVTSYAKRWPADLCDFNDTASDTTYSRYSSSHSARVQIRIVMRRGTSYRIWYVFTNAAHTEPAVTVLSPSCLVIYSCQSDSRE